MSTLSMEKKVSNLDSKAVVVEPCGESQVLVKYKEISGIKWLLGFF